MASYRSAKCTPIFVQHNAPIGAKKRTERVMGKFLVLSAAAVALNVFAPPAHAQDYVVNGHAASKGERVPGVLQRPGWPLAGRRIWLLSRRR